MLFQEIVLFDQLVYVLLLYSVMDILGDAQNGYLHVIDIDCFILARSLFNCRLDVAESSVD
jgi:hypothetical protein